LKWKKEEGEKRKEYVYVKWRGDVATGLGVDLLLSSDTLLVVLGFHFAGDKKWSYRLQHKPVQILIREDYVQVICVFFVIRFSVFVEFSGGFIGLRETAIDR
jgi:hypothetical protein